MTALLFTSAVGLLMLRSGMLKKRLVWKPMAWKTMAWKPMVLKRDWQRRRRR